MTLISTAEKESSRVVVVCKDKDIKIKIKEPEK